LRDPHRERDLANEIEMAKKPQRWRNFSQNMHVDFSTTTGDSVVVFTLAETPSVREMTKK
jgi:hypothetical protein